MKKLKLIASYVRLIACLLLHRNSGNNNSNNNNNNNDNNNNNNNNDNNNNSFPCPCETKSRTSIQIFMLLCDFLMLLCVIIGAWNKFSSIQIFFLRKEYQFSLQISVSIKN